MSADIGRRIKEIREERNLTQEDLANRLGTYPQSIWRYESGARTPSVRRLEEIAEALGVSAGDLFPQKTEADRWRAHVAGLDEEELSILRDELSVKVRRLTMGLTREDLSDLGRINESIKRMEELLVVKERLAEVEGLLASLQ